MIVTVTLNPAIDRTIAVPDFKCGEVNRADTSRVDAGGKGINVSKALKELGSKSVATGFVAGKNGRFIKESLHGLGITTDFVEAVGETRVNIKIVSEGGVHTDINENGFDVSDHDLDRITKRLRSYLKSGNIIIISGSAPSNMSLESYEKLCRTVTERDDVKLIADATGEHLRAALSANPYFVKPNVAELSSVLGYEVKTLDEICDGARKLIEMGAQNVAVSMGAEGAVFVNGKEALLVRTPPVEAVGPVGAGDVMVAGIAHAIENGNEFSTLARYAAAAAAASVTVEGTRMAPRRTVLDLFSQTTAEKI